MPGRTAAEAYRSFIDPIQAAFACLGSAKITTTPGGRAGKPDIDYQWTINGGDGIRNGPLNLRASMRYRFIDRRDDENTAASERWKIRTTGYMYHVEVSGKPGLDYHWHPQSTLAVAFPHAHAANAVLAPDGVITSRTHIPTGRVSIESVVRLLITDLHWPPQVGDWDDRLTLSEAAFQLHASWSQGPPPA